MNILVLAGGLSTERNVSLSSGSLISAALKRKGHRVLMLDVYEGVEIECEDPLDMFTNEACEAFAVSEEGWQVLPALSALTDLLTLDLSDLPGEEMEQALLAAPYYLSQYRMRLVLSASQSRWVAPVEAAFSDYQIISTPPTAANG